MLKKDELATATSCLNKAADNEPIFVLRAKDPHAAVTVRIWAEIASHWRTHEPEKIKEAMDLANSMDRWRHDKIMKQKT